jgi:hypothetical protein
MFENGFLILIFLCGHIVNKVYLSFRNQHKILNLFIIQHNLFQEKKLTSQKSHFSQFLTQKPIICKSLQTQENVY